jgi:hypothetical protein
VSGALSKSGLPVRTDPALRKYRDLFEENFSREERLRDIAGPGLPLGVGTLSPEEALAVLRGPGAGEFPPPGPPPAGEVSQEKQEKMENFIRGERESLLELRALLSGKGGGASLEALLDRNDLLWAHFPECAAAGGRRPPGSDLSFLKRVRVEIDPVLDILGD